MIKTNKVENIKSTEINQQKKKRKKVQRAKDAKEYDSLLFEFLKEDFKGM